MREQNNWHCDETGCTAVIALTPSPEGWLANALAAGWYQCREGFMVHRCPDHAPAWRAYDQERAAYDKRRDTVYVADLEAFEAQWWASYAAANPEPLPPSELNGNAPVTP